MRFFYLILAIFLLQGCAAVLHKDVTYQQMLEKRSVQAKQLESKADSVSCKHNSTIKLDDFYLKNNLWGKSRIKKDTAVLCTFHGKNGVGWKWQIPDYAKGVIGYPAIQVGHGPWSNAKNKLHGFPIQLDAVHALQAEYDTEMWVKNKKYNLAFDLWLSSEFQSNKNTITTEIMVWEDYNDFKSYGKKVEQIITPFGVYDVMKGYIKNDEFGQNWQYYAFVRQQKRRKGKVDLQYFLQYLIKNHDVHPNDFLTSVEFGNEIGNSSGFTWLKKFDWVLN